MKLIFAFFRLIRTVNLVFIVMTQFLFQYCVVEPSLKRAGMQPLLNAQYLALLILASVFIAAAGYIINDYFDINIDLINKPRRLVVEKLIKRRWAIVWHLTFSAAGLSLSYYVSWKVHHNLILGLANTICVGLLWFYSTTFKKKFLTGNLVISLLTSWVVLILYVVELERTLLGTMPPSWIPAISRIFKLAVWYGGFAFIISLIRECAKDIEDLPGDEKYGCRTMPIRWGIRGTKIFMATWMVVLIAAIIILQFYLIPYGWWTFFMYSTLAVLLPLLIVFRKISRAKEPLAFGSISQWFKFVMVSGILSLLFFLYYA